MKKTLSYLLYLAIIIIANQICGMIGINNTIVLIITILVSFYYNLLLFILIKFRIKKSDDLCIYNQEMHCPKNIWHSIVIDSNSLLSKNKMMDDNTLMEIEKNFSGSEIWLMSLDFCYESDFENGFFDIVEKNLIKGVNYIMFALDSNLTRQRAISILEHYKKNSNRIKFVLMSNSSLQLMLPLYNFMIMNPHNPEKRTGYICIGENDSKSNTLYEQLDKNLVEKVYIECSNELNDNKNIVINNENRLIYK